MVLNIALFTMAYPPMRAPRAIQISRLVKYSRHRLQVLCAEGVGTADPTLPDRFGARPEGLWRHPRGRRDWLMPWNVLRYPPVPDPYRYWAETAVRRAWHGGVLAGVDGFVTFGQPMSDHVAGLWLKKRSGLPWLAHFSDPWADSPYRGRWPFGDAWNRRLEARVVEEADRLLFTSEETVDLVMSKYPASWRKKASVLPHAFDPDLYEPAPSHEGVLIRHVGNFYKPRTPDAFLRALVLLQERTPVLCAGLRVELIGRVESDLDLPRMAARLPPGMLVVRPPVDYLESLRLMAESDVLLVLDAPFDHSVFLPSKLVDYLGARRPIFAVTPEGATARLVERLGDWVVRPGDPAAIASRLEEVLLSQGQQSPGCGGDAVRQEYSAPVVTECFDRALETLAG